MKKKINFLIDYKKSNFISDYKLYLTDKYKNSLKILVIGLVFSIILFLCLQSYTNWKIMTSMGFGLIILISSFVFFKILDILVITKSLNKSLSKITLGKMNLILEPTSLEFNQNGRKRIVFKSQIAKCILKSDIIFLVEKNQKNLPMKINKNEMTEGSFEKLIDELKLLKIIKK